TRVRISLNEVTDLAVVTLTRRVGSVVVSREINIVRLDPAMGAVDSDKLTFVRQWTRRAQVRRHQGKGHARALHDVDPRLDILARLQSCMETEISTHKDQGQQ